MVQCSSISPCSSIPFSRSIYVHVHELYVEHGNPCNALSYCIEPYFHLLRIHCSNPHPHSYSHQMLPSSHPPVPSFFRLYTNQQHHGYQHPPPSRTAHSCQEAGGVRDIGFCFWYERMGGFFFLSFWICATSRNFRNPFFPPSTLTHHMSSGRRGGEPGLSSSVSHIPYHSFPARSFVRFSCLLLLPIHPIHATPNPTRKRLFFFF